MKAIATDNIVSPANGLVEEGADPLEYFFYNVRYYSSDETALERAKSDFVVDIKDLDELVKIDLLSVFMEAVKNALEHGNRFIKEKSVCVKVYRSAGEMRVNIEDEGCGWQNSGYGYLFNSRKIGLRLIHSLSDEVSFSSGGRKVSFTKYLDNNPMPGLAAKAGYERCNEENSE